VLQLLGYSEYKLRHSQFKHLGFNLDKIWDKRCDAARLMIEQLRGLDAS
jgi:hypothetical protein